MKATRCDKTAVGITLLIFVIVHLTARVAAPSVADVIAFVRWGNIWLMKLD